MPSAKLIEREETEQEQIHEQEQLEKERELERKPPKAKALPFQPDPEVQRFRFLRTLGIITVLGFLIIGTASGMYPVLESLMEAPCLGCLGLYPDVELDFTFDTVDELEHPDYVLDALKDKGPVFIEFTQNDENCPPCKRMRPYVENLEKEYKDDIYFVIININEHEMSTYFQDEHEVKASHADEDSYHVYDLENIAGGRIATPTFIIVTINQDENGEVRPSFTVGYGEFIEENDQKTSDALADALEYSKTMYHHYYEMYISE